MSIKRLLFGNFRHEWLWREKLNGRKILILSQKPAICPHTFCIPKDRWTVAAADRQAGCDGQVSECEKYESVHPSGHHEKWNLTLQKKLHRPYDSEIFSPIRHGGRARRIAGDPPPPTPGTEYLGDGTGRISGMVSAWPGTAPVRLQKLPAIPILLAARRALPFCGGLAPERYCTSILQSD